MTKCPGGVERHNPALSPLQCNNAMRSRFGSSRRSLPSTDDHSTGIEFLVGLRAIALLRTGDRARMKVVRVCFLQRLGEAEGDRREVTTIPTVRLRYADYGLACPQFNCHAVGVGDCVKSSLLRFISYEH